MSQPHYLATILLIIQREQKRLNDLIPQLSRCKLSLGKLRELHNEWPSSLSMISFHPWILDGIDNLVDEQEKGRVFKRSYRSLARQLECYEQGSRSYLTERNQPYKSFLNQEGRVLLRYQKAFESTYEAHGSLSFELQASVVRYLLDGYDLPRLEPCAEKGGWVLVFDQARPVVEGQVIDLALVRRRRSQFPF